MEREGNTPDGITPTDEDSIAELGNIPPPSVAFVEDESQAVLEGETPDWLSSLGEESSVAVPQQEHAQTAAEGETEYLSQLIKDSEEAFQEHMNNDFNISGALGAFFDFIHQANVKLKEIKKTDQQNILEFVDRVNSVLGVIKKEEAGSLENDIFAPLLPANSSTSVTISAFGS